MPIRLKTCLGKTLNGLLHKISVLETSATQYYLRSHNLPRNFDDGGLVDINGAPVDVLAALPGVGWERARRIVAHREAYGALSSVDDLVTHGMLPYLLMRDLHDQLVAVPA